MRACFFFKRAEYMRRRTSRRHRRGVRHRSRRYKRGGGGGGTGTPTAAPAPLGQTTATLAKTLAANFIQNVGAKMGIDVTNPRQTAQTLAAINRTMTDPQAVAQLKTTVANAAETGKEMLQAAEPFIDPLVNKTIEEGEKAASKMGEAAVKIGLNTAEEIPGVGVLIGTARSLSNAGEALTAVADAAAEITDTAAETVEGTTQNWKRLQAEKAAAIARTQASLQQFGGGGGGRNTHFKRHPRIHIF